MVNLEAWCYNTRLLMSSFTWVDFSHVYREHNKRADILSKEGLYLALGHLLLHNLMMMRLLGKTHFNYFRICSFYFSLLSHGFSELSLVLLSSCYRIFESHTPAWIRYLGSCYILYCYICKH